MRLSVLTGICLLILRFTDADERLRSAMGLRGFELFYAGCIALLFGALREQNSLALLIQPLYFLLYIMLLARKYSTGLPSSFIVAFLTCSVLCVAVNLTSQLYTEAALVSALVCGSFSPLICRKNPMGGCVAATAAPLAAELISTAMEFATTGKVLMDPSAILDVQLAAFMLCMLTQLVIKRVSILHT